MSAKVKTYRFNRQITETNITQNLVNMNPYAFIDQSDFPLVTVTFSGAKVTEENFQTYLDELSELYAKEEPFIMVFDASEATLPNIKYQRRQALWMAEHYQSIEAYCLGTAYVIPNDIIRTVLKAIFALQQQPSPYEVFATLEGGLAWAKSRVVSV